MKSDRPLPKLTLNFCNNRRSIGRSLMARASYIGGRIQKIYITGSQASREQLWADQKVLHLSTTDEPGRFFSFFLLLLHCRRPFIRKGAPPTHIIAIIAAVRNKLRSCQPTSFNPLNYWADWPTWSLGVWQPCQSAYRRVEKGSRWLADGQRTKEIGFSCCEFCWKAIFFIINLLRNKLSNKMGLYFQLILC